MHLYNIFIFLFCFYCLYVLPFQGSVSITAGFVMVEVSERALLRHISSKPAIVECLRRQKFLCMTLGAFSQLLLTYLLYLPFMGLPMFWYGALDLSGDKPLTQVADDGASFGMKIANPKIIQLWGKETIVFICVEFARIVRDILTPWILIRDYSRIKLLRRHLDDIDKATIVREIVAFGMIGTTGIFAGYIFLFAASSFIIFSGGFEEIELPALLALAIHEVLLMQRELCKVLISQMLFCMAVAERDILQKKFRLWIAALQTAVITIGFHFLVIFAIPEYFLSLMEGLPKSIIAVVASYYCWRKYQLVLAEAYSKSNLTISSFTE